MDERRSKRRGGGETITVGRGDWIEARQVSHSESILWNVVIMRRLQIFLLVQRINVKEFIA